MEDAFYIPDGDGRYRSTEWTRGPWDPDAQHGGPPCALLGRAVEACAPRPDLRVARVTFEILRPVPIATLEVRAEVVRPGRRVELVEASLRCEDAEVMQARAWRVVANDTGAVRAPRDSPPPPQDGEEKAFFPTGQDVGYHKAMECRFTRGAFLEVGPAAAWLRMRLALVAGEDPTPLQRVLVAADTGNGLSTVLDYRQALFVNTDLSVFCQRDPSGEWIHLDSTTTIEAGGSGLAESLMWDGRGPIGRAVQTLLVAAR